MFGKLIGFSLSKSSKGGVYTETIVPFSQESYGKADIEVSGTFVANDIASVLTITITNYYPSQSLMTGREFYKCRLQLGYMDGPNTISYIEGEVKNVYTQYTGVDSKTVIEINNGVWMNAYGKEVDIRANKGETFASVLRQFALAIGYNLIDNSKGSVLNSSFSYTGNLVDGLMRIKDLADQNGLYISVQTPAIYLYKKGEGTGKRHRINMVSSPIRIFDGGCDVRIPYNPKIHVGDTILIEPKFFINTSGVFVTKIIQSYGIYQIDFGFSTTGDTNYMSLRGYSIENL